jgi:hypothetical protein
MNPAIHSVLCDISAHIEWFDRRYGYWIVLLFLVASPPFVVWAWFRLSNRRKDWVGWLLLFIGVAFWFFALISGLVGRLPWDWWNDNQQEKTYQQILMSATSKRSTDSTLLKLMT